MLRTTGLFSTILFASVFALGAVAHAATETIDAPQGLAQTGISTLTGSLSGNQFVLYAKNDGGQVTFTVEVRLLNAQGQYAFVVDNGEYEVEFGRDGQGTYADVNGNPFDDLSAAEKGAVNQVVARGKALYRYFVGRASLAGFRGFNRDVVSAQGFGSAPVWYF